MFTLRESQGCLGSWELEALSGLLGGGGAAVLAMSSMQMQWMEVCALAQIGCEGPAQQRNQYQFWVVQFAAGSRNKAKRALKF